MLSARNDSRPLAFSDQFDHLADQNLYKPYFPYIFNGTAVK